MHTQVALLPIVLRVITTGSSMDKLNITKHAKHMGMRTSDDDTTGGLLLVRAARRCLVVFLIPRGRDRTDCNDVQYLRYKSYSHHRPSHDTVTIRTPSSPPPAHSQESISHRSFSLTDLGNGAQFRDGDLNVQRLSTASMTRSAQICPEPRRSFGQVKTNAVLYRMVD